MRFLNVPEANLIGQMLLDNAIRVASFLDVSKPTGRSTWTEPAVWSYPINDDCVVFKNAEEKISVPGVETGYVSVDQSLDFGRRFACHGISFPMTYCVLPKKTLFSMNGCIGLFAVGLLVRSASQSRNVGGKT